MAAWLRRNSARRVCVRARVAGGRVCAHTMGGGCARACALAPSVDVKGWPVGVARGAAARLCGVGRAAPLPPVACASRRAMHGCACVVPRVVAGGWQPRRRAASPFVMRATCVWASVGVMVGAWHSVWCARRLSGHAQSSTTGCELSSPAELGRVHTDSPAVCNRAPAVSPTPPPSRLWPSGARVPFLLLRNNGTQQKMTSTVLSNSWLCQWANAGIPLDNLPVQF